MKLNGLRKLYLIISDTTNEKDREIVHKSYIFVNTLRYKIEILT